MTTPASDGRWTETFAHGTRRVIAHVNPTAVSARLYVNDGTTPTLTTFRGKTYLGLRRWVARVLESSEYQSSRCGEAP